jgi:hypothetical protein
VTCKIGPAHGNADTVALACQRAGDMTAQKAGTADDGDQFAAQMAELVDALASGASVRMDVEVRVLFWAPITLHEIA